jgi:hypothetical protein
MDDRDLARPAPDLADDGVPATEEVRDEALRTGDPGVAAMPAPDRPWGAEDWGTTDLEQREGEPLDVRLRRENPDREPPARPGARVHEPGTDDAYDESFIDVEADAIDVEADVVGELDFTSADMLSPEEAAMTVRDSAPGGTYDDSPGYLDED